jgi:hypothetical protein
MIFCKYGCGQIGIKQLKDKSWICSESYQQCPVIKLKNSKSSFKTNKLKSIAAIEQNSIKKKCKYCDKLFSYKGIKQHKKSCYLNPKNLKLCVYCNKPIKNYKSNVTCSHKCGYKIHTKDLVDGGMNYKLICFNHHEEKCIICGEDLGIEVHHYDENRSNNDPSNLVPLCPTHHKYCRMKDYYYIIKECVDDYVQGLDIGESL